MLLALLCAAAVEVVGFSPDGRYAAYVEHDVGEGSGIPWARLRIANVSRGADAMPPVEIRLDSGKATDTEEEAVRRARAKASEALGKLSVASWAAPHAIRVEGNGELKERSGAPLGTLQITAREATARNKCDEPFRPLLLRLLLFLLDDDRPKPFAEEKAVPRERPCASSCELSALFSRGKAALALVKCAVPGFEGPATRTTAYAGPLPFALDE
ncbi:MAG TPA: DUF2259 domain-containing protein [Myxococcales bacterium]|nr:DUF2259 domain-containing protein [Myxococcales bacterium]